MYEYSARLIRLVDGDTFHARVDLGLDVAAGLTVRLYGVNAPEVGTAAGRDASAWAARWFRERCPDAVFILRTVKDRREKYGRYLGIVISPDGAVLNDDVLAAGHAVPYTGKGLA